MPCPACEGARLRPESRAVLVGGHARSTSSRRCRRAGRCEWLDEVELSETERHIARLILREIAERLRFLENVGIGYLSMDRAAATLSGGEAQRIRLATQIGSSLVGVLYILDEPSIGLHQRDNSKLIATLERLRDLGNTVIVVEHDEQTMRAADHLVDLGPGRGRARRADRRAGHGGARSSASRESLTGQFLAGHAHRSRCPAKRRKPSGYVEILRRQPAQPARRSTCSVPLGVLTCVTGVSGSGKSTLVNEVLFKAVANRLHRARQRPGAHRAIHGLDQLDKIIAVDQSPIGRTPRSNPATYTGLFDVIRDLFSQDAGGAGARLQAGPLLASTSRAGAARSAAATGRSRSRCTSCPTSTCRASSATASATTARRSRSASRARAIADVLDMPVEEALEFFEHIPKIRRRLETLNDVGLGYIRLGQPATTLSGGEAQRVKLATELSKVATGPHAVHPRRADDGPALRRRAAAARGAAAARRRRATASS